jgi:hypothetical protein
LNRSAGRFAVVAGFAAFCLSGTGEAGWKGNRTGPVDASVDTSVDGAEALPVASRDIDVDPTLTPEVDGCVRAKSVVDVAASHKTVRDAILDLEARVEESWIVDSVDVYLDEVGEEHIHRRAKWTLSVLGVEVVYHTVYHWDKAKSEITWDLDPDRENDLQRAVGRYHLGAGTTADQTRVTYVFEIGTRHRITQGLKRRLTVRSVRELLDSIRTRSEG